MKAYVIEKYKQKPMQLKNVPMPEMNEDQVLVEIYATSVNPVDFKIRDKEIKLIKDYDMPLVMGNDFSGIVKATGKNVTKFKTGDPVYGRPNPESIGTFAEYIAVHQNDIALKPMNITFEEAASIPLVGLTSYQAINNVLKIKKGDKVLIHAGSGGVGTFAIQFAKAIGAYVATTVSDKGIELVKSLGADEVINYKTEDFSEILSDYDGVFDTQGGETLEKSFKVVKDNRTVVSIAGVPTADFARVNNLGAAKVLMFGAASRKLVKKAEAENAHYEFMLMKNSGRQMEIISELIEAGKIKPVIDKVFDFKDANEAMAYSEEGHAKGKIVIKVK